VSPFLTLAGYHDLIKGYLITDDATRGPYFALFDIYGYSPPLWSGTSDEHISLIEHLSPVHSRLSGIVVTTPQAVALLDAMKCVSFARTVSLPLLGVIENMSGYACPCCGEISNVFSTGGGESMAKKEKIPFLGTLPIDTELVTLLDAAETEQEDDKPSEGGGHEGFRLLRRYKTTSSAKLFGPIVENILSGLSGSTEG
jgi:hypothetical protein